MSSPILIGFDGSELSRRAIQTAGALLGTRDAIVLHVYEPVGVPVLPTPAGVAMVADTAAFVPDHAELDEIARRQALDVANLGVGEAHAAGLRPTCETAVAQGTSGVATAIVETAARRGATMIVVGSHGRSAIGAALLGSVSTAVLHRSTVPVLVVPARPG
ncbi:MAG TPA: universal stress protein [Solirubrobacteraceae bacterium]